MSPNVGKLCGNESVRELIVLPPSTDSASCNIYIILQNDFVCVLRLCYLTDILFLSYIRYTIFLPRLKALIPKNV